MRVEWNADIEILQPLLGICWLRIAADRIRRGTRAKKTVVGPSVKAFGNVEVGRWSMSDMEIYQQ